MSARPLLLLGVLAAAPAPRGTLVVEVVGLHSDRGEILVDVHDRPEAFPTKPREAARRVSAPIAHGRASVALDGLPYGTYAVAVVHDENGNHELDTNFLGIPREGVGASNDARGSFGPPKFRDAKFVLASPRQVVTVTMHY